MPTNENHRQAHMTLMARKICGIFAIFSSNFGPPTYFISHYYCGRALHAVLYRREFFKKRRAELFDYGVATVMSKVTHMLHGVHGFDTTNVYVLLVRFFGSLKFNLDPSFLYILRTWHFIIFFLFLHSILDL